GAFRNPSHVPSRRILVIVATGTGASRAGSPRASAISDHGRVLPTLASSIDAAARPGRSLSWTHRDRVAGHSSCGTQSRETCPGQGDVTDSWATLSMGCG